MNDIEIGDYVRTRRGIGKVLEIKTVQPKLYGKYDVAYLIDVCPRMYISESTFIKHSKNIIDLIEVGDIIEFNGEKYQVIYDESYNKLGILIPNKNYLAIKHSSLEFVFEQNKYVTILTKEQYMQNCYTVEREKRC